MGSFRKVLLLLLAAAFVFGFAPKQAQADTDENATCYYSGYYGSAYATVTVTDEKGNELVYGDQVSAGTVLKAAVTLKKDCKWAEKKEMYVQGQTYELDNDNSFTFTVDPDYTTWFYVDFAYGQYPTRLYSVKIKGDSHVKSYEFISDDGTVAEVPAGEKKYEIDGAWALSSGAIALKVIFEEGYECKNAAFNTLKFKDDWGDYTVSPGEITRTSDTNLLWVYLYDDENYTYTLKITSKKAEDSLLDIQKYTVAAPKIKSTKFKKEYVDDDYYTSTITLTFGKGKKASVFSIFASKYGKKGEVSTYLNYDSTIGSDAKKYEVIDLSGVTGVSNDTFTNLVDRIYHYYKQGLLPNLKAICLPKNIAVSIYTYDDEFRYYPVQIITVH